jgi:hypothetical protein
MEITFEIEGGNQQYRTTIAGVTKVNKNGTDRQGLVKALKRGQELTLIREPDNPFDKFAVALFTRSGQQLGYTHAGDARLASHMDMGGAVSAKVVTVTGGPGLLGWLFPSLRKHYGCVIEITKGDFDWQQVRPYMEKSKEIERLLDKAKKCESQKGPKAITLYREAIEQIVALDNSGKYAAAWRRVRYPIDRLSLLLEKSGDIEGAYQAILCYEEYKDAYGLTAAEKKAVLTRKTRLEKKIEGEKR